MRHAVLALLILLEGAAFAPAHNHEWAEKLFAQGGTSHDFGNVPRGAVLSYRFPITNLYAVPLRITDVRISCSCVTATPSVQALQPKETGYINVTMDGRRFTGPKTVTIYVTVGPQYISTATLQVSANCRADIVFNPGQVVFGVVPSGQARTLPIDIEYAGALEWKITGIAEHTTPLETRLEQVYRRAPGQSAAFEVGYRLHVTLKPNAPAGTGRWELLLQTNDPGSPTVPVLVE